MRRKMSEVAKTIFASACEAVSPSKLIRKAVNVNECGSVLSISGNRYKLNHNVYVAAFGKAVLGMAASLEKLIGPHHLVRGVASVPYGSLKSLQDHGLLAEIPAVGSKFEIREGAKDNFPDGDAMQSAEIIEQMARNLTEDCLFVVLVSGGGSALLPAPVSGITLDEKCQTIKILSQSGATIDQLNTVRQHLSRLKGGGLAKVAQPAQVISLIFSDIIGNDLEFVASGPTVQKTTKKTDALRVIKTLGCLESIPTRNYTQIR